MIDIEQIPSRKDISYCDDSDIQDMLASFGQMEDTELGEYWESVAHALQYAYLAGDEYHNIVRKEAESELLRIKEEFKISRREIKETRYITELIHEWED